jgi:hypothetical protein
VKPEEWFERMRDDARWTNTARLSASPRAAARRRVGSALAIVATIVVLVVATLAIAPALRAHHSAEPATTRSIPFRQAHEVPVQAQQVVGDDSPFAVWSVGRRELSIVVWGSTTCPDIPTRAVATSSTRIAVTYASGSSAPCTSDASPTTTTFATPAGIDTARPVTIDLRGYGTPVTLQLSELEITPPCVGTDFTVTVDETSDGGRSQIRDLRLTNSGAAACGLQQPALLGYVDSEGKRVGPDATLVTTFRGISLMQVAPGESVHLGLTVRSAGSFADGCAVVRADRLQIVLPGELFATAALFLPDVEDICTSKNAQQVTVSDFQTEPTIPIR